MVIKKMNSVFHKHSRWLFGAFTVIIIVSFLGFLTPGNFGIGGFGSARDMEVGSVYGKKITYDDLMKQMRALACIGLNADEKMAFEFLAIQGKAEQIGVVVTDAEMMELLRAQFQTNGKYDPAKYREFVESRRKSGFSEEEIFDGFRIVELQQKLGKAIRDSIIVTDSEMQKAYRELNTRFSGKAYTLKPQESKEAIPTEDVKKFFDAHAANYNIDGSISALVIEFPYAAYTEAAKKAEKDPAKVAGKAKELAKNAAEKFSDDVYDSLKTLPVKEQLAAFQKMVAAQKLTVKARKFNFNAGNAGNLSQTDYALLKSAEPVEISLPAMEEKAAVIGFVTDRVAPRPAKFEEVAKQVFKDCKQMRTLLATEAKAKELAENYAKCKDDAARTAFLKQIPVAKSVDFSSTAMENFKNQSTLGFFGAAAGLAPGQAAASGDTLIVLAKREVPTEAATPEALLECRIFVLQQKQYLAQWELQEDIQSHCLYRAPGSDAAK